MKKTFTINLNNIVFHIDDDAYELLQSYLDEVSKHFEEEGERADIMTDIEGRIAELFSEKMDSRKNVITLEDVGDIIKIMGKPSQFDDSSEEPGQTAGEKEYEGKSGSKSYKKFYRDIENRLLGGVAAGLGLFMNLDILLVRVIFIVLTILTSGTFILIYLLLWVIVPKALTTTQKLEMHGEDVNIQNIKIKMQDAKEYLESDKFKESANDFGSRLLKITSGFLKIIFSFIGGIIGIAGGILIAALIFGLIVYLLEPDAVISVFPNFFSLFDTSTPDKIILLITSLILIIGAPIFALIYWSLHVVSKREGKRSASGLWVALILWLAGIFMFIGTGAETMKKVARHFGFKQKENWEWVKPLESDDLNTNSETRTLAPFHAIDASGAVEVLLTQQAEQSVTVHTLEDFLPHVKTEVKNGQLKIYVANKLISPHIRVEIGLDSISKVKASGASRILFEETFELKNLNMNLTGASRSKLNVNSAQKLDISISGASRFDIEGKTDTILIDCSGASAVNAGDLISRYANVKLSGASKTDVHATKVFKGNASGASRINCYGNPEEKTQIQVGSSTINFK